MCVRIWNVYKFLSHECSYDPQANDHFALFNMMIWEILIFKYLKTTTLSTFFITLYENFLVEYAKKDKTQFINIVSIKAWIIWFINMLIGIHTHLQHLVYKTSRDLARCNTSCTYMLMKYRNRLTDIQDCIDTLRSFLNDQKYLNLKKTH